MNKKYIVELTAEERAERESLLRGGEMGVRKIKRIQILLQANEGWSDEHIAEALDVGLSTVERARRKYARKLDGRGEAHLIAQVCGPVSEGFARWTLRLLADELVKIEGLELESISHEAVRQALKKNELKPWRKEQWVTSTLCWWNYP